MTATTEYRPTPVACPAWCRVDHETAPDCPHVFTLTGNDDSTLSVDLVTDEDTPGPIEMNVWFDGNCVGTFPADAAVLRDWALQFTEAAETLDSLTA